MKIIDCQQGSIEWLTARAGIPTASCFDSILTPGGKLSKSAEPYMFSLLAERMMGRPIVEHVSFWMDRGSQMEEEAVQFYEFQRDLETIKVGFMTNEAGTIGASPDRLVGDDGLLEIKVPKESTHVSYLLKKAVDQSYYPQVQGQLWISERKWLDILSYHPEMPPALIRVERDEKYICLLSEEVQKFSAQLEEMAIDLRSRGWIQVRAAVQEPEAFMDSPNTVPAASLPPSVKATEAPHSASEEKGAAFSGAAPTTVSAAIPPSEGQQSTAGNGAEPSLPGLASAPEYITVAQRTRLFAILKEAGYRWIKVRAALQEPEAFMDSPNTVPAASLPPSVKATEAPHSASEEKGAAFSGAAPTTVMPARSNSPSTSSAAAGTQGKSGEAGSSSADCDGQRRRSGSGWSS